MNIKKHSDPILYIFIALISIPLIIAMFTPYCFGFILLYLFAGNLIYLIIADPVISYWKTILLWYPAILFDKPELTFLK